MFAEKSFVHENKLFLYGCTKCFVRLNRMFCIFAQNVLYGGTKHFTRLNRLFLWQLTEGFVGVNEMFLYGWAQCFAARWYTMGWKAELHVLICLVWLDTMFGTVKQQIFPAIKHCFSYFLYCCTQCFVNEKEYIYIYIYMFAEKGFRTRKQTLFVRLHKMFRTVEQNVLYVCTKCFVRLNGMFCMFAQNVSYGWTGCFVCLHKMFCTVGQNILYGWTEGFAGVNEMFYAADVQLGLWKFWLSFKTPR